MSPFDLLHPQVCLNSQLVHNSSGIDGVFITPPLEQLTWQKTPKNCFRLTAKVIGVDVPGQTDLALGPERTMEHSSTRTLVKGRLDISQVATQMLATHLQYHNICLDPLSGSTVKVP